MLFQYFLRIIRVTEKKRYHSHRAIARQVMVFYALCGTSGPHLKIIDEALSNKNAAVFKGVALHSGENCDVLIQQGQIFKNLFNNVRNTFI